MFYRRWISGRGPLRRVRCSFASHESCSAYGLRVAQAASSGREAARKILRRLRRCGDACLRSDGTALSWTEMHDRSPGEVVALMRGDDEADAAIATMLHARRAVGVWCADRSAVAACDRELESLEPHDDADVRVKLEGASLKTSRAMRRRHPTIVAFAGMMQRAKRRLARRVAFAIIASVVLVIVPSWFDAALVALFVAASVLTLRTIVRASRRFAEHASFRPVIARREV